MLTLMHVQRRTALHLSTLALLLFPFYANAQKSALGLQAGYAFVNLRANGNISQYEDYSNLPVGVAGDFRIHKSFYFSPELSFSKRTINTVFEDFFIGKIPSTLQQNQTELGIVLRYYFLPEKRLQPFAAAGFALAFSNPKESSGSTPRYSYNYELKRSSDINSLLEIGVRGKVLQRLHLSLGARFMSGANTADLDFSDPTFGTGGYQATLRITQFRVLLRAMYALGEN